MVALDARTGAEVWDAAIPDSEGMRNPGGPMVADGVVMQGMTTQAALAAFVAATRRSRGSVRATLTSAGPCRRKSFAESFDDTSMRSGSVTNRS
jgi:hypothetical protein